MKFDISNAETQFAVLSTNLNSFVSRVIQEYEQLINTQAEQLKQKDAEIAKLKANQKEVEKSAD